MIDTLLLLASFGLLSIASDRIGVAFRRFGLPTITGYLFAGAIAGSFALDLIPSTATEDLRFVDEIALAVIAFVAGSELYLKEIKPRLRPILSISGGIIAVTYVVLALGVYLLTGVISFTEDLGDGARLATALLGAAVLLALSPPSTIAVIKELSARGRFTRTVLGVTVTMDVAIIVLFATITSVASPLLTDETLELSFVPLLLLDLAVAAGLGYVAGLVLRTILSTDLHHVVKSGLVLGTGFGVYELGDFITEWSKSSLGFEIHMEPLLIALIAGFYVTNYTRFREQFDELLHRIGPLVYVAFFTITGLSLKLDVLWSVLPIAIALFVLRAAGIAAGSLLGSRFSGEPKRFRLTYWAAFITQAGIALGLAREVAVQFPTLGDAFATLIISVVVINEIVGPLFLKWGLRRAKETHEPDADRRPGRHVVILGVEGQSIALARTLQSQGWSAVLADTDADQIERLAAEDVEERHIDRVDEDTIRSLVTDKTEALVAMLGDDADNQRALSLAAEMGVQALVARPADPTIRSAFMEDTDILTIDPGTAVVSLLEQAVTSPQSATLLLRRDPQRTVSQVKLVNPDLDGTPVRDLRLPTDVLLLQIIRDGNSVVVHGHTDLRTGDDILLLASEDSLTEIRSRLSG